ncbi:hypothetical protein MVES1_003398 [Malassezia vespertilionis]|uniref:Aromatic-L-amino-acid decarboxylase n=1 Tax=Malassezia vespertilionis TaxID=2020962 RepID=A0A2N1J794_9BASI|nr:uncharacterized protein MVES1_003398 [Malassezia vespertilionis]PKI82419.1 hypothetical protein MVES_003637 [Malassezia vespertilionis]WFD08029.1 hypothetical protein MVES1_003398 [Malassezia vespertilionis]
MDREAFRQAGYRAVDEVCEYFATLESLPVAAQVEQGYLAKQIPAQAPEHGEAWDTIQRDFHTQIMPGMTHWQHPMFYGFFPSNVTYEGILADIYTAATNNPGFNWTASPAVTELEFIVLDWLAGMVGLGAAFHSNDMSHEGGGVMLGGASEATFTMAIAARERALDRLAHTAPALRASLLPTMVMYGTSQTHTVGAKAAKMLGLQFRALDVCRADDYALRGATLQAALDEDRAKGLHPFILIATYGTTNSCAIDRLDEIARVAASDPTLWLHVDAAYGGVTLALEEERMPAHLDAIRTHFDSFSLNLHKWGLVHMECAPTFLRNRRYLANALSLTPEYLKSRGTDAAALNDLRNLQIVLGRRFRALKVWFVLRSFGQAGFRTHLRNAIAQAAHFAHALQRMPAFEIVHPPRWGLVMFRLLAAGTGTDVDALNRRFNDVLLTRQDAMFLTPTVLPEVGFCLRIVFGAPATEMRHVDKALDLLAQCAAQTLHHADEPHGAAPAS